MSPRLQLAVAITAAAGAFAIAILTFTGATWPAAPGDEARAHLAFANAFAAMAFFGNALLLGGAFIAGAARSNTLAALYTTLIASLFLLGFLGASVQLTLGMDTWFEESPRMGPGTVVFVRILTLIGFFGLLVSPIFRAVPAVRKLMKAR
ncbi:MAG: hypothetical protein AAGH41_01380 [Pseudomonadota bacterium]